MKSFLMLHTSSDLYGAGRIFLNTILMLKSRGHKVHVALTGPGPLVEALEQAKVPVERIKLGILRRRYMNPLGLINRAWYTMLAIFKLRRLIRRERVDIVFSNACGIYAGALAAKLTRAKHVFHVHEIISDPTWFANITGGFMRRYSDKVVVVSEAVRSAWTKPMRKYDIDLVYNGLDYRPFTSEADNLRKELGIGSDEIVVGMIARVHFWKGQTYFLQIAALLRKQFPNLKFAMAGDAFPGYEHLYDEVAKAKNELGLEEAVIDLGFRSDIPKVLNTFDVFVLPSILPDPLPTVILEAMACARPVVATEHGGALEMVVDSETGFHIPYDDPSGAAEKIAPLISDKSLRQKMGEVGQRRVLEHFSKDAYEQQMMAVLSRL